MLTDHTDELLSLTFYSLILDNSVGLSVGIKSARESAPETLGSNPTFSRRRQLVSFRVENRFLVPEHRNTNMYVHMYAY